METGRPVGRLLQVRHESGRFEVEPAGLTDKWDRRLRPSGISQDDASFLTGAAEVYVCTIF